MSRATMGGSRVTTQPPGHPPRGERQRFNHLMRASRPAWADDPTVTLPCQQPSVDPDWWFEAGTSAENRAIREHARQLCGRCPMRGPCHEQAKANREGWGMWGGQLMEPVNRPGARLRKKGAAT